jgi:hypothetical protein
MHKIQVSTRNKATVGPCRTCPQAYRVYNTGLKCLHVMPWI